MLDRRKGIVSPPESAFPQVLGAISDEERKDVRLLTALYFASTFVPTPLSIEEAEQCMQGSNLEILTALGLAIAEKLDRDRSEIKAIVWKSPRNVGMHAGPLSTDGKFIVLRRNPHNVFESQFRVEFGKNNRMPLRFAVFRESYEHAFSRLPEDRTISLEYDDLPGALFEAAAFLGVDDCGEWESRRSSLDAAASSVAHMTEVMQEFRNRDPEKRARLDPGQIASLDRAMAIARPLRPLLGPVRAYFDRSSLNYYRKLVREQPPQIASPI
jgi:hypothetical protein